MKIILIFCICSLINVILSTLKSLLMINTGKKEAIIINAVCYGFYTLVVKQLTAVNYLTAVIVTVLANIVGVWLSYLIMDKFFKKEKIWRITATLKNENDYNECCKLLKRYNIGYNRVSDLYCLDIYSNSCKESDIIKRILNNFNHKYFIQVMNVDFKQSAE